MVSNDNDVLGITCTFLVQDTQKKERHSEDITIWKSSIIISYYIICSDSNIHMCTRD